MPARRATAITLWPCDAQARPLAAAPPTPWTRYLAWADGQVVGGGGFTGPPRQGRVEIGYFTLPGQQRQGHGRRTASALLALAWAADASLTVIAHTRHAPRQGRHNTDAAASAHILLSLGFGPPRPARASRVGPVWRWALPPTRPDRQPQAPTINP